MSRIRSKDTKPELQVRKWLHRKGFRYRLHHKDLPGTPDLAFIGLRTVVFVNGCFWHGHSVCTEFRLPKTNTEFWEDKIARNRERDLTNAERLAAMNWNVEVVWECELKRDQILETLTKLEEKLSDLKCQRLM
jgi:DNA mismatch endonuclease, patch repair protein